MTPREHKAERDKRLQRAAQAVCEAVPDIYGSVKFQVQEGKLVNMNIEESVRPDPKETDKK